MTATTVRQAEADTALARSQVYGLLATLFQAEPDAEFLERLRDAQTAQSFAELGFSLGPGFRDLPLGRLVEDLAVEYTQLFVGPGPHLSPHESVHTESGEVRDGELWGRQTVKVKAFVEAAGLSYEDNFHGMPDHISAELEFMGKLTAHEAELWCAGDEENALGSLRIQRRFFDEHLNQWVPRFCQKIIDRHESAFYTKVAELTGAVLSYDDGVMAESLTRADGAAEAVTAR
jgi:TorA maturation chaperone TorD